MNLKLLVLAALLVGSVGTANAQKEAKDNTKTTTQKKSKKEKKEEKEAHRELNPYEIGKLPGQVYLFGFSQEFGDTIAYISDVCRVDSIMLQKKTKFLPFRNEFSLQFKEYIEESKGVKKQTTCVFYSVNKTSLIKKQQKMRKRYLNMEHTTVVNIGDKEFKFIHPLDK